MMNDSSLTVQRNHQESSEVRLWGKGHVLKISGYHTWLQYYICGSTMKKLLKRLQQLLLEKNQRCQILVLQQEQKRWMTVSRYRNAGITSSPFFSLNILWLFMVLGNSGEMGGVFWKKESGFILCHTKLQKGRSMPREGLEWNTGLSVRPKADRTPCMAVWTYSTSSWYSFLQEVEINFPPLGYELHSVTGFQQTEWSISDSV